MLTSNQGRIATRRSAFTLIELLVVIGIIAILISVLLPVLSNARRASYKAACLANLHQIGDAFKMYQGEYKGAWPVSAHFYVDAGPLTQRDKRWHDFISRYLMSTTKVTDPATGTIYTGNQLNPAGTAGYPQVSGTQGEFGTTVDPLWIGTLRDRSSPLWGCQVWKGSTNGSNALDDRRVCGYAMNRFAQSPDDLDAAGNLIQSKCAYITTNQIANPTNFFGSYLKMTSWRRPGERVLIYEGNHPVGYFATAYLKQWPYLPENPGGIVMPQTPDISNFPVDFNRHGKRRVGNTAKDPSLNVLFADGHCSFVSALECYRGMRFN